MSYPLNLVKQFNKQDFKYIMSPLIILFVFVFFAVLIFPKPAKIQKDGVLKDCKCFGLSASPKPTKGVHAGEAYCLGIPVSCVYTKISGK